MKTKAIMIILFLFVLVGITAPVSQSSAADKTTFTATGTFDPFGLFGSAVGQFLSPGTVACPDSEPTGDPPQCPTGSRGHFRGARFVSRLDSVDPRVSGWVTVEANGNWDAEGSGPVWGVKSLALDAGGTWDGTFEGRRLWESDHWVELFHGSMQGTGGAVDGMQLLFVDRIVSYTLVPVAYFGTLEGRILDPHSK